MPKYCYFTMVTNDRYMLGGIGLALSLKAVKAQYPLIFYITKNISSTYQYYLKILDIPYVIVEDLDQVHQAYNTTCLNKAYIYTLKDYDKVFWLDSDAIVLDNIDYLFEKLSAPAYMYLFTQFPDGNFPNAAPLNGWFFLVNPKEREMEEMIAGFDNCGCDEIFYWQIHSEYFKNAENNNPHDIFKQIRNLGAIYHTGFSHKWWEGMSITDVCNLFMSKNFQQNFRKIIA